MLSALIGIGVVLLWRPKTRWDRPLILAVLVLGLLFLTNFNMELNATVRERGVSVQQLAENFKSLVGQSSDSARMGHLEETVQWRLSWWRTIVGYTFGGEHFWTGKGYGVNLADDDGFQVAYDRSVRSPHNVFMTILARSGVPGLLLWILFLLSYGWMLVRVLLMRKHLADPWDARYALWLLAYWSAFLLNASFDVFLEGPMGGVWFWGLVGIGLAYFSRENYLSQAVTTHHNPGSRVR
jgi:O-antigen ligase